MDWQVYNYFRAKKKYALPPSLPTSGVSCLTGAMYDKHVARVAVLCWCSVGVQVRKTSTNSCHTCLCSMHSVMTRRHVTEGINSRNSTPTTVKRNPKKQTQCVPLWCSLFRLIRLLLAVDTVLCMLVKEKTDKWSTSY